MEYRSQNRRMFWRMVWRLLGARRGRLLMILLALGAGAAVTSALLNLQVDAKRRLTSEFRTFGANMVVEPKSDHSSGALAGTLLESAYESVPVAPASAGGKSALLVLVGQVRSTAGVTRKRWIRRPNRIRRRRRIASLSPKGNHLLDWKQSGCGVARSER